MRVFAQRGSFALLALLTGCAQPAAAGSLEELVSEPPSAEWRLPKRLKEVSALAMSGDQRLFAVDDETAVIYQVDYEKGRLTKAFAFGEPILRGDFEGLALLENRFYLLTSDGVLYDAGEGEDGAHVSYNRVDTGLGSRCEFEGLGEDVARSDLLLVCKELRKGADIDVLSVYRWHVGQRGAAEPERIHLPVAQITTMLGTSKLSPSGIVVHPMRDTLVLVAARERALVELDADGQLRSALVLPQKKRHPQAEGIEFTADGSLILADEGQRGRATMAVYTLPD